MRKTIQEKKGFTLIELLVVITIIWILSAWAVATFTTQLARARDSTRITDQQALDKAIQQVYFDLQSYPSASWEADDPSTFAWVRSYLAWDFPSDPKAKEPCYEVVSHAWWTDKWTPCDYLYAVWEDANTGIALQSYVISIGFESKWNTEKYWSWDWWEDDNRYEIGYQLENFDYITVHQLNADESSCKWITGDITDTLDNKDNPMLIRWSCE